MHVACPNKIPDGLFGICGFGTIIATAKKDTSEFVKAALRRTLEGRRHEHELYVEEDVRLRHTPGR